MQNKKNEAFTLIEILIVIGIILGLMAYLVPIVLQKQRDAASQQCRIQLGDIKQAPVQYKMAFGKYPDEKEGLKALFDEKAFKKASGMEAPLKKEQQILDSTGAEIVYHTGRNIIHKDKNFKSFELIAVGKGTEEEPDIPVDGD